MALVHRLDPKHLQYEPMRNAWPTSNPTLEPATHNIHLTSLGTLTVPLWLPAGEGRVASHRQTLTFALAHRGRHSFGIKADVKDNIWYIDEMQVVFPVGNNIVLHNVEQKIQRFIAGTQHHAYPSFDPSPPCKGPTAPWLYREPHLRSARRASPSTVM
jgi:hypothetical protein